LNTFTDFKKDFYSRIHDFTIFDCGEINLLKVVLDGLKVNYVSRGKISTYLFYPLFLLEAINLFKRYRQEKTWVRLNQDFDRRLKSKKVIVSDIGRIFNAADNSVKSIYFENIIETLGREKVLIVADKVLDEKFEYDINIKDFESYYALLKLNKEERSLRRNLLKTFMAIRQSKLFSIEELHNIKIAFQLFFYQYKTWNGLLNNFYDLKVAYFICHYHKEGQIYALKKRNITCIELQHGLIAPQDIFYIFPKSIAHIKQKALFADRIFVYGDYWKSVLLKGTEYEEGQIDIFGYYLFDDFSGFERDRMNLKSSIDDKNVILVTTQTFLHGHFIDFVSRLEKDIENSFSNTIVIIKPHPAENSKIYQDAFKNSNIVKVISYPLPILFEVAKIHVTIYSTTLYDAIRYGIRNFVFKVKSCEDYVDEIISSGIATEILDIAKFLSEVDKIGYNNVDSSNFYSEFDRSLLKCMG
jgi:hypothetical protein